MSWAVRFLTLFAIGGAMGLVVAGCGDDSHRDHGSENAHNAGGIKLILDPAAGWDSRQKQYRIDAARIQWEHFATHSPWRDRLLPTAVWTVRGTHVNGADGVWDWPNNRILVPGDPADLRVIYHELYHRHAPRHPGNYWQCHCPASLLQRMQREQGEALDRIHRELGPVP